MIRFLLILILFVVAFTLAINNLQETIRIHYFFGYESRPIHVYLLIVGAFLLGMVITVLLLLPEWVKNRLRLRRQERTLQRLESELRQSHVPPTQEAGPYRPLREEGEEI